MQRLYYHAQRAIDHTYEMMDDCEDDPDMEDTYRALNDELYDELFDDCDLARELASDPKNVLFPCDDYTRGKLRGKAIT